MEKIDLLNVKNIDPKKVEKTYLDVLKVFQKAKLNVKELLLVIGNITYTLGASVGGYKQKGPGVAKLEELYLMKPTVDVALMISGLNTTMWIDDIQKVIDSLEKK